ncbi:MAG: hypothetical protein HBSAPP02_25380 [Phycisphaerae bacterium]|nr:MAG: Trm112 family protein [Planctomycetia bacterium]RIK69075.1 MAG: hypothetical protein DCC66_09395 [Planctomycetota bacterium]GJQ27506.1 MAG: hypothetical protein HBSAPP02_25380 [Phycisphaerae bacterium]
MIDKPLLDILACPACKQHVQPAEARSGEEVQGWLVCTGCGLRYPIREGIPVMLVDEAAPAASGVQSND